MTGIVESITGLIIATISTLGYGGVIGLMALESACVPLPSEVIMPFAGYLVSTGRFDLPLVAVAGAVGCNIGSTIAYAAGCVGGRAFIHRFGRWIWLDHSELDHVERFFARYGGASVFIGRLLPFVRTFISFPAGMARMPMVKFQIYSFLGSLPWCFVLAWIGARLGDKWNADPSFRAATHRFDLLVVLAVIAALAWYVLRVRRGLRSRRNVASSRSGSANSDV